jgi:hypothetical protein
MSIGQGSDSKCHTLVWTQSQLGRWGPIVHGGQPQLEARSGVSRASKECTAAMAFSDVSHQGEPEPWQVTVLGTAITLKVSKTRSQSASAIRGPSSSMTTETTRSLTVSSTRTSLPNSSALTSALENMLATMWRRHGRGRRHHSSEPSPPGRLPDRAPRLPKRRATKKKLSLGSLPICWGVANTSSFSTSGMRSTTFDRAARSGLPHHQGQTLRIARADPAPRARPSAAS